MKVHEYQTKEIFQQHGIPVLESMVLEDKSQLDAVIDRLGEDLVVKAQVYAGGRGKGGGVKVCRDRAAIVSAVDELLGHRLLTPQTDDQGLPVDRLLLEKTTAIEQEYYIAMTVDRGKNCYAIIASEAGGMDIEEVAAKTPEKIHKIYINPTTGLNGFQCRQLGFGLGLSGAALKHFSKIITQLAKLGIELDASLVEINPLARVDEERFIALDAKLLVDDNALFRQPGIKALHDVRQENEKELQAQAHDLNYVALEGNIGCMVNGAGLAMATMDLIKLHGGKPANFLDVGGTATAERVAEALKIILSDANVKTILVNIFGGIVRCDLIAEGIIQAVEEVGITIPVIVRLEGTNAEQGRVLLKTKVQNIQATDSLNEAAEMAVKAG